MKSRGASRWAGRDGGTYLVELKLHSSVHVALGEVDGVHDKFHLWGEPEAVVAETGKLRGEMIPDSRDLAARAGLRG